MGLRGPKPEPTRLKVVKDNPGRRPLNDAEPPVLAFSAAPPPKVRDNPRALAEWNKLVAMLNGLGVLSNSDYIALGNLCYDTALLESCQEKMAGLPLFVQTKRSGALHPNPLLGIIHQVQARVDRGVREFGLTPSSRSGVRVEGQTGDKDPWDDPDLL